MTVFDKGGSGFLDRDVVEDLIRNQGEGLNPAEIHEFVNSIKYNDQGKISYDDLMRLVYNEPEKKD
jgi:Ca2+-binding EF-hand superfamily protein